VIRTFLVSAKTGVGIPAFIKEFEHLRSKRDVYVIGTSNAGKSTFVNQLINQLKLDIPSLKTVSAVPGTTLDLTAINIAPGEKLSFFFFLLVKRKFFFFAQAVRYTRSMEFPFCVNFTVSKRTSIGDARNDPH
jgi:hypothetical protein